MMKMLGVH
jgi:hypothetical protein